MPNGDELPHEIVLDRDEAKIVLFAIDAAIERTPSDSGLARQLERAAGIIVEKFLPDLPEL